MSNQINRKVYRELYEILQKSTAEIRERIPGSFMAYLKENMDTDYEYKVCSNVDMSEIPMMEQTKSMLAMVYSEFLAE